jgi:hypothetical protein
MAKDDDDLDIEIQLSQARNSIVRRSSVAAPSRTSIHQRAKRNSDVDGSFARSSNTSSSNPGGSSYGRQQSLISSSEENYHMGEYPRTPKSISYSGKDHEGISDLISSLPGRKGSQGRPPVSLDKFTTRRGDGDSSSGNELAVYAEEELRLSASSNKSKKRTSFLKGLPHIQADVVEAVKESPSQVQTASQEKMEKDHKRSSFIGFFKGLGTGSSNKEKRNSRQEGNNSSKNVS